MPRVSKKAAQERRDKLIALAQKEFFSRGFENTTVKNIADQLDLATGTFYYHFKSKEEILVAVSNKLIEEEARKLNEICEAENQTLICRLKSSLNVMYETYSQSQYIWKQILANHNVALHRQIFCGAISKLSPFLVTLLKKGNEEGAINVPYPEEMAEIMFSLLDFYARQHSLSTEEARKKRFFKAFEHTLVLILGEQCRPIFSLGADLEATPMPKEVAAPQ